MEAINKIFWAKTQALPHALVLQLLFLCQVCFSQSPVKLNGEKPYGLNNFSEGLAKVYYWSACGFIDKSGKFIIGKDLSLFSAGDNFSEGLILVTEVSGKKFFMNKKGEKVVQLQKNYAWVSPFAEGLSQVEISEGLHGYINRTGKEVITLKCDGAYQFCEGRAGIKRGDKYGYIDRNGKLVIPFDYDGIDYFHYGKARVQKNKKWGYIDTLGNTVIDFIYDEGSHFYGKYAWIKKGDQWGMIDKNGKEVIPLSNWKFDNYAYRFAHPIIKKAENSNFLFPVQQEGKFGFVDTLGTVIVPFIYNNTMYFEEDMAGVFVTGKGWGYIDIKGKEVIPPQFDFVFSFSEGYSVVEKEDFYFFINKKGDCVINCRESKNAAEK